MEVSRRVRKGFKFIFSLLAFKPIRFPRKSHFFCSKYVYILNRNNMILSRVILDASSFSMYWTLLTFVDSEIEIDTLAFDLLLFLMVKILMRLIYRIIGIFHNKKHNCKCYQVKHGSGPLFDYRKCFSSIFRVF